MARFEIEYGGKRYEVEAPDQQTAVETIAGQQEDQRPGYTGFLNRGIAGGLGAPVDLATGAINAGIGGLNMIPNVDLPYISDPIGGSTSIARGLNALGVDTAPPDMRADGLVENVAEGIGGAAGMLIPGGLAIRSMQGAGGVLGGAANTMATPFAQAPLRATAAELAAGGGAGAGMDVAERLFPDNELARGVGAIVGGGITGLGPNMAARGAGMLPGVGLVSRGVSAAVAPFTQAGALVRARNRFAQLVEDPQAARLALTQENIGGLSPATQTGERRLMALEQAVRSSDPQADLIMRTAEGQSGRILRDELAMIGGDATPMDTRTYLSERVTKLTDQMHNAVERASLEAERKINALTPQERPSAASMIVREEIERALGEARKQEELLWQAVPRDVEVPTSRTYEAFQNIVQSLPRAQMDDIPAKAQQFLAQGSNSKFGQFETVSEMHGLYGALREEARLARAAGNYNRARIADNIANSIIEDIGGQAGNTQGPAGVAIREAIDFSRTLNETFHRGSVGKVLGYAREGGHVLPAELTLDATIGRGGIKGAVGIEDLRRAAQNAPNAEAGMQSYMLSKFSDYAIRDGLINPGRAAQFVRANVELLDRMPGLRQMIDDAVATNTDASRVTQTMVGRTKAVHEQSAAGTYLNASPGSEVTALYRAANPQASARQLVLQASRDPTGQAVAGLKGSLVDDLIAKALTRQFDDLGQPIVSGRSVQAQLSEPKVRAVTSEILSPGEVSRMDAIVSELRKLETAQGNLPDIGGVISDTPNTVVSFIFRTLAARQGAKAGQGASGASLLTANFATRRMNEILDRLTNNRAEQMIRQAVLGDRELFDSLLAPANEMSAAQVNRIAEFILGTAGGSLGSSQDEIGGSGTDDPSSLSQALLARYAQTGAIPGAYADDKVMAPHLADAMLKMRMSQAGL